MTELLLCAQHSAGIHRLGPVPTSMKLLSSLLGRQELQEHFEKRFRCGVAQGILEAGQVRTRYLELVREDAGVGTGRFGEMVGSRRR